MATEINLRSSDPKIHDFTVAAGTPANSENADMSVTPSHLDTAVAQLQSQLPHILFVSNIEREREVYKVMETMSKLMVN